TAAAYMISIATARGDDDAWERCLTWARVRRDSTYLDTRACAALVLGRDAIERGRPEDAIRFADEVVRETGTAGEFRSEACALGVEAALALGDEETMERLVAFVDEQPPSRA